MTPMTRVDPYEVSRVDPYDPYDGANKSKTG